jgi:hypothetical protein
MTGFNREQLTIDLIIAMDLSTYPSLSKKFSFERKRSSEALDLI